MGNRKLPKGFVSLGTWGNTLNKEYIKETKVEKDKITYVLKDGNDIVVERKVK